MRSTLFYIPYEWNGLPVVGLGWLLLGWILLSAAIIGLLIRKQGWNQDTASYVPFLAVVGLVIMLSGFLSRQLTRGRVQGSAIAILIGHLRDLRTLRRVERTVLVSQPEHLVQSTGEEFEFDVVGLVGEGI